MNDDECGVVESARAYVRAREMFSDVPETDTSGQRPRLRALLDAAWEQLRADVLGPRTLTTPVDQGTLL